MTALHARTTGSARTAVVVGAIVALAAGLTFAVSRASAGGAPTIDDRTMAVAEGLRCPVCQGESVAASSSRAAIQMRDTIRRQLEAGRSPDRIRAWFAARYGSDVLMTPATGGIGLVAWLGPFVLLTLGLVLIARTLRHDPVDAGSDADLHGVTT